MITEEEFLEYARNNDYITKKKIVNSYSNSLNIKVLSDTIFTQLKNSKYFPSSYITSIHSFDVTEAKQNNSEKYVYYPDTEGGWCYKTEGFFYGHVPVFYSSYYVFFRPSVEYNE